VIPDLFPAARDLAWPLVIALAWIAGELGHRWMVPRISMYCLVGFACGSTQLGILPAADDVTGMMLANIAFGLILFEFGYRINLHWLRTNPWLGLTGLLESLLTFLAVYGVARLMGAPNLTALLLASLAMATSPASLVRVINEQRSSGQVTERVLHLAALNCVLAVFAFKVVVGFWTFESSGNLGQAISNSLLALVVSAGLGAVFGIAVPGLLRLTGRLSHDATLAFAISVVMLVGITHALKFSPLLAGLTFGLVARHRRITLNQAQRNFGALGDLLAVVLFAHVAATVEWPRVMAGVWLALALVGVRMATKVLGTTLLARVSGISWRKGALTGMAMMPMSVFVILLLEDTRYVGVDLIDTLAPLAAATLLLDFLGPLLTQQALRMAGETHTPVHEPAPEPRKT
jgi:Kef-type K+ transport system membrane component KefB